MAGENSIASIMVPWGKSVEEHRAICAALDAAGKRVFGGSSWEITENTGGAKYTKDGSIFWTPGNTFAATMQQAQALRQGLPAEILEASNLFFSLSGRDTPEWQTAWGFTPVPEESMGQG